jgi:TolB protein
MSLRLISATWAATLGLAACGDGGLVAPEMLREHEITFGSVRDLYAVTADGSRVRNLTSLPTAPPIRTYGHSWSPDGSLIAYVTDNGLSVITADGGGPTFLTGGVVTADPPVWAPDGSQIAFRGIRGLWLIRPDGTNLKAIGDDFLYHEARWAPGAWIAFYARLQEGRPFDVYTINPDGSGTTNLTDTAFESERSARWSPAGTHLAFLSTAGLEIIRADGGDRRVVTPDSLWVEDHAWSPDGTALAVTGWYNNNADIYVIRLDGSGHERLTEHHAPDYEPAWSPDGHWIAFQSGRTDYYEVYVMNADGSAQTRVTDLRLRPVRSSIPNPRLMVHLQWRPDAGE